MKLLEVKQVSKRFGELVAVDRVRVAEPELHWATGEVIWEVPDNEAIRRMEVEFTSSSAPGNARGTSEFSDSRTSTKGLLPMVWNWNRMAGKNARMSNM